MIKIFLISSLTVLFLSKSYAQEQEIIEVVEKDTHSTIRECNEDDFRKAIYNGITYPLEAIDNREEGKVYAQLQVHRNGQVDSVKVVRGAGGSCDRIVLERIRHVADSMKLILCSSRKSYGRKVKAQKMIIPFSFSYDNFVTSTDKNSNYWNVLGRVTRKKGTVQSSQSIAIEFPNEDFEYGNEVAFKVKFLNTSKKQWKLVPPDISKNVKFYYFLENNAHQYPENPVEPKSISRIGIPIPGEEHLKRYEEALKDTPQDLIEWRAAPNDKSIEIVVDSSYVFTAYLPKPYSFEIGAKYYGWIEYKDKNNRIVSNTVGFKVKLTKEAIEKLIELQETKSKNYLKANAINTGSLFYEIRGPSIHKEQQIENKDWKIVYEKASVQFKKWWLINKDSDYLKRIFKEINREEK